MLQTYWFREWVQAHRAPRGGQMREVGWALMTAYPKESLQHALGYHMSLCALSMDAALERDDWDATLRLHARAMFHFIHLLDADGAISRWD